VNALIDWLHQRPRAMVVALLMLEVAVFLFVAGVAVVLS
jgi:hypothetical protein